MAGLNPENTVVNLFNYSTGQFGANGSDTVGTTGGATPIVNYQTWLNNRTGINYGHLLTFGDGMRHLGYWNQGIVAAYGEIARSRPGMQNIVAPLLTEGYPSINGDETSIGPNGAQLGGYNYNPELFSRAQREVKNAAGAKLYDEMVYFNAGPLYFVGPNNSGTNGNGTVGNWQFDPVLGWNIDPVVQAQASAVVQGDAFDYSQFPTAPTDARTLLKGSFTGTNYGVNWDGYQLDPSVLSLRYLFDPDVAHGGKQSYTNVTGLFQIDEEGYYYYNMRKNFAEYVNAPTVDADGQASSGHFVLYNKPAGVRTDGTNSIGNFFPFNKAADAFREGPDGQLENVLRADNTTAPYADHHLGMTLETDFRQPVKGVAGGKPMTFEFVGDDDVWVFIDDVLVLDLGGIHSEIYGTINFSTGDVNLGTAFNSNGEIFDDEGNYITEPVIKTNIKAMFERAGRAEDTQWNGSTFASSTSHTLKMFYLERGNYDSSLAVRFNLQQALYQHIKKVDQDGSPLPGAEFDLYEVHTPEGIDAKNADTVELGDVEPASNTPVCSVVTDSKGKAKFVDQNASRAGKEEPFNFADRYNADTNQGLLYILRERKAPTGYKPLPTDMLIRFDPERTILVVNNRYQTGAYASFNSYVTGITGSTFYGQIGEDGGVVSRIPNTNAVPEAVQQDGLVVAIPMMKKHTEDRTWLPLYGDNLSGFNTVPYPAGVNLNNPSEYRLAAREITLQTALMQAAMAYSGNGEAWHLSWDSESRRLVGTLENLPGRADRYLHTNPDGDMRMFYAIITPEALARTLGKTQAEINAMTAAEKYNALGKAAYDILIRTQSTASPEFQALISTVDPGSADSSYNQRGYTPLDSREFIRNFRSVLYIPNEQRQLRVVKIDQNGNRVNGVEFALFETREAAQTGIGSVASGTTATVEGQDGMLIFEPIESHSVEGEATDNGYADMPWPAASASDKTVRTYFLKETKAPDGFALNETIIPVKVGVYSIYADAGTAGDGVSVMAGVGKLTQTMIKFAAEGDVDVTLRDITAFAQKQPSDNFSITGWQDDLLAGTNGMEVPRSMNLHYGQNATVDYGLSDADGGKLYEPFFVTDTGFIRTRVQQNLHEHDDPNDPYYSDANADDLLDADITGLFSLINTVVVTDTDANAPAAGSLQISKTVEGNNLEPTDYERLFHFKLELFDSSGKPLPGSYRFFGTDRAGAVSSGQVMPLHHNEALIILGIPEGSTYSITELDGNSSGFHAVPNVIQKGTIVHGALQEANFINTRTPPAPDSPVPGIDDSGETRGSGSADSAKENPLGKSLPRTGDGPALPALTVIIALAAAAAIFSRLQLHRLRYARVR